MSVLLKLVIYLSSVACFESCNNLSDNPLEVLVSNSFLNKLAMESTITSPTLSLAAI